MSEREFTITVRVAQPANFDDSAAQVVYAAALAVKALLIRTATDFDRIAVDEWVSVPGTPYIVEISRTE